MNHPALRFLPLVFAAFLLGGCGTLVSNVTTYHSLSGSTPLSGSVTARIDGSGTALERQTYADRVVSALSRQGFAAGGKGADYTATLSYSVDGGREYSYKEPIYGQVWDGPLYTPYWVPTRHGPRLVEVYNQPDYAVVGYKKGTAVAYTRTARLALVRAKTGQTVWEARNRSTGPEREIGEVLPGMIDAMVRDFPGVAGKTRVVQGSAQ